MSSYVTVTKTSKIRKGRGKAFTVNGKRIAVFNVDDENFYALGQCLCPCVGSAWQRTGQEWGGHLPSSQLRVRYYKRELSYGCATPR